MKKVPSMAVQYDCVNEILDIFSKSEEFEFPKDKLDKVNILLKKMGTSYEFDQLTNMPIENHGNQITGHTSNGKIIVISRAMKLLKMKMHMEALKYA